MSLLQSEDIAENFLDLDLSDEGPSNVIMATQLLPRDSPVTSQPRAKDDLKCEDKTTFLTLPVEIRLRIYDILLVSRFDRSKNPSWAVGSTNQKKISLETVQASQYRTMEPRILGMCKQVYNEAVSILYSENAFLISNPESIFQLHAEIRRENFQMIKSLYLFIPYQAELNPWLDFLSLLALEAHGLRFLEITWDAMTNFLWLGFRKGLGNNSHFVRALAEIRGLDGLVIKGFYPINWPSYLEREMGIPVKAHCGRDLNSTDDTGDLEDELDSFEKYQFGTQDLIP
jgi:hypothetical protein